MCRAQIKTADGWRAGSIACVCRSRHFSRHWRHANCAYAFEHPNTFKRQRFEYQSFAIDIDGALNPCPFQSIARKAWGRSPTIKIMVRLCHSLGIPILPFMAVVKAMASAKRTYPEIDAVLSRSRQQRWARKAILSRWTQNGSPLWCISGQPKAVVYTFALKQGVPQCMRSLGIGSSRALPASQGWTFWALPSVDACHVPLVGMDRRSGYLWFFYGVSALQRRLQACWGCDGVDGPTDCTH